PFALAVLALLLAETPLAAQASVPPRDALGDALPQGAIARLGTRRLRCDQEGMDVAWTADGARLWTVDIHGAVSEWDAATGRLLRSFDVGRAPVRDFSLPRDSSRIAVSRDGSGASVVDASTGSQQLDLERYGSRAAFSPDGRWLAVWGPPFSKVNLLDAQGALVHELNEDVRDFFDAAFSPDGTLVALLGLRKDAEARTTTGVLSVRDTASGEVVHRIELAGKELVSVAFTPDGSRIVCGDDRGGLHGWDVPTGAEAGSAEGFERPVRGLAFAPDGRLLAQTAAATPHPEAGVGLEAFTLRDGGSFAVVREVAGHYADVSAVTFAPDGKRLASMCRDHLVRLWDPATGARLLAPAGHDTGVSGVAADAAGALLVTGGDDGQLGFWNGRTGELTKMALASLSSLTAVALSPDGRLAASSALDGGLQLWVPAGGEQRGGWAGDAQHAAQALAFGPDGRTLASAETDGKVRLRDVGAALDARVEPGTDAATALALPQRELDSGGAVAFAVAWSPDGKLLASGSSRLRLFDPHTGAMVQDIKGTSPIQAIAFSPDGALVATGNADRSVRVYQTADGKLRGTLTGHAGRVAALAFSSDGRTLASGSDTEPDVRLWDVERLAPAGLLSGHVDGVNALVGLAPDRLVSASADGVALVWRLPAPAAAAAPGG
ncbi:MAG TPA: WD40 repeat domain-containing protein, partial [Planctomycetota bacterium]|nr:WD40 repeat domain-containing protein [Planctomycetota bacterium]